MKSFVAILFFIIGTLAMVFFYEDEILLLGIMAMFSIIVLAIDKWKNNKQFFIAMIVGGICENLAVFLGGWKYAYADYIFTSLWLPIGWGAGVILLKEAFAKNVPVTFSKKFLVLAIVGAGLTALFHEKELILVLTYLLVTIIFFFFKYYKLEEIRIGIMAAIFGTVMEGVCMMAGAWGYNTAMFTVPLWLPLCWFNAFLIMRRIIKIGGK